MARLRTLACTLAAAGCAATVLTAPARADGNVKDAPAESKRKVEFSWNIGATTDYVFRGVSQSSEDPAFQAGFDITYGIFYLGAWGSGIDFDDAPPANVEIDWYAGIKPKWGKLTFDFGVIYYSYPNAGSLANFVGEIADLNYVEVKAGVSGSPIDKLTLGATAFYSPDYQYSSGPVWTLEGTAAYEFPKFWLFTPTISALIGYQTGDSSEGFSVDGTARDDYVYWNAGLALAVEKLTLDFRYWDTNIGTANGGTVCAATQLCDERSVFSTKVTF